MIDLDKKKIDRIIRAALKEDIGPGDITSRSVIDRFLNASAVIVSRQKAVLCGVNIIERVFSAVDCSLKFRPVVKDGDNIEPEQEIAFIEGNAQAILKGERTALNFLGMLSGTAFRTHKLKELVKDTRVKIYDTRKTVPLNRYLQKYAVTVGGGYNHRKGLWDMVLLKDNHIKAFGMQKKISDSAIVIKEIIKKSRENVQKNIKIEIEVETLKECEYALQEKPDVIMLDNMTPETVLHAVELRNRKGLEQKVIFEVSGGITKDNIMNYAKTGVDIISIGSLTASVDPVDFSLEVIFRK
ncbi:MAG: carboxylating nicotinate-nucleotide diphosphorylase [Candidatus Omnitrophota bacterium]